MRTRRSVLFLPGDSRRKIEKAATLDVDTVVLDLEDGVALDRKVEARRTVREALAEVDFGARERVVRVNPPGSALFEDDVAGTVAGRPDAYLVPKVGAPEDVHAVERALERHGAGGDGGPTLLVLLETARGIVHAAAIAAASTRVEALLFGAEDLAGDVGLVRTAEGMEILYARSAVVLAAAAHGLQAIDTLWVDLADDDGLARDAARAVGLGFDGKMAIHPRQVAVIHHAFAPSEEEAARARRLLEAHAAHQAGGVGAFVFEGRMVDWPMVRAAEKLLARARPPDLR